jgi:thiamine-phosphate pyrophosphorylase
VRINLPRIYPLTDTQLSGLSHAEQVKRLIAGGARLIQLRDKNSSPRDFYHQAAAALRLARESEVRLIINDRVDIALALKADGVHLGQTDLPVECARRLLGEGAIVGLSTHNLEQAEKASALPVDYVAFGPVFGTQTKVNPDPTVGLKSLSKIRSVVGDLPLVAIGGINSTSVKEVLEAGADTVAVISSLLSEPLRIEENTRALLALSSTVTLPPRAR